MAIYLRASRRQRDVIDRAAQTLGKSRSDVMLEIACRAAEDVMLDRRYFALNGPSFDQFTVLLESPPPPTDKLRRLLCQTAPGVTPGWESATVPMSATHERESFDGGGRVRDE